MRNIRLDICYDGSRYQGWQRQVTTEDTIQGKIETALSRILGESIEISGSGRTDAGTHAKGQVASFHCESTMPCEEILTQLRRYLPGDIGIKSCKEASQRFHARLNARSKTYCYRIWNSDAPCVFERRYVHILPEKLDIPAMCSAAEHLLGRHDFAAFCTNAGKKKSTFRTLTRLQIEEAGEELAKGEAAARERLATVEGILERNAWLMNLPRTVEYYTEGYAEYVKYVISYEFDESEAGFHVLVEDYTGGNLEAAQGWVSEQEVADGGATHVEVVYEDLTGEKL